MWFELQLQFELQDPPRCAMHNCIITGRHVLHLIAIWAGCFLPPRQNGPQPEPISLPGGGKPALLGVEGTARREKSRKKWSQFLETLRVSQKAAEPKRQLGNAAKKRSGGGWLCVGWGCVVAISKKTLAVLGHQDFGGWHLEAIRLHTKSSPPGRRMIKNNINLQYTYSMPVWIWQLLEEHSWSQHLLPGESKHPNVWPHSVWG